MPKFVPVVDTEKSLLEQREDTSFDKHRRFDNPHKVDRGWQQGNVGWGVLGAFGSNSKDDAAQIIKRAEGSNKMIKNEKGLWVKAKELDEEVSHSRPGRGRGGGVSVYDELASRSMGSSEPNTSGEKFHNSQFDDADYRGINRGSKGGRESRDNATDRHKHGETRRDDVCSDRRDDRRDGRRDSRHRDRLDDRRDDRRNDKSRDRHRDRSRSRSPNRHRDERSRSDSRRSPDRRKKNSRSRSNDRYRSNRDHDRRRHRSNSRERSSNTKQSELTLPTTTSNNKKASSKDTELTAEELTEQAELMRSITAVQVINRFHEVFAQDTLFPSERLHAIGQVFSPEAVIASLKSGVVHIAGQTAVEDSFAKTAATQPSISKRIYIEYSGDSTASDATTTQNTDNAHSGTSLAAPKVTFCLDFHRPGTAPGLGDRAKHTVLLYRCTNAVITHIWGMVDHEQLSQPDELEKGQIMKSKVWACVKPIVVKDVPNFDESRGAHFHNYDRMEVWGMF